MECSTLILDLDGTISDPSLGISRCFNHALSAFGYEPVSEQRVSEQIGPPLDQAFLKLVPGISEREVPNLVAKYRERYGELGYAENTLYPGMPEALQALAASGLRLGVCTSKRRDFALKILAMFEVLDVFEFVDGGDIGVTKQSQLAGLLASGEIDQHSIMVGDRSVDIVSARRNDLRAIGVLWGFGSEAELAEASPVKILERVEQLPESVSTASRP
ncbi:MAG: HAD hydrolase-like protein [Pseudomonadota bacterium]